MSRTSAAMNSAAFNKIPEGEQAYYLDSIRKNQSRWYTDSISSEKVYFGYTYKDVRAKEINLGLDLKGGMNVMLQVQLEDLVKALAGNNNTDPDFLKALSLAKERSVTSQSDLITLFGEAWKEVSGGQRLAQIFGTYEMRDRIKPESTDDEVVKVIQEEAESTLKFVSDKVSTVLLDENNKLVAFGISFPTISPALQKAKGRMFPFGWVHFLKALRNFETTDLMLNGAVPEWQNKGVSAGYYCDMADKARKVGNKWAISNPQIETNSAVNIWNSYEHEMFMRRRCYVKTIE